MLVESFRRVERQFPLVGVGGVENPATAMAKIEAGATWCSSIRRWSFAARGLPGEIKRGLAAMLAQCEMLADRIGRAA